MLFLIKRELKLNLPSEKKIFMVCAIILCFMAIPYRSYLISQGYENGLANADMQCYVSLADQIKNMGIGAGFKTISNDWNLQNANFVQIWGYRLYIYFLVVTVYKWTFIPVTVSIYLVSIWQVLAGLYSMLRIYNSIKDKFVKYEKATLLLMLLAPSVWYGCVRLLREVFMLLCMQTMICALLRNERARNAKLAVSMVILTVIRPYYAVLMIPLLFLLMGKEKLALIIEAAYSAGLALICIVRHVSPVAILGVVLSPNYFNQVIYVLRDALAVYVSGQITLINFIGSVWNMVILFYCMISFLFREEYTDLRYWSGIGLIQDISMMYAIAYAGNTELRHKLFFVIPYMMLLNSGAGKPAPRREITDRASGADTINFFVMEFMLLYALVVSFTL